MKFDLITENEHLWAVRYDDCLDNVLDTILEQWNDVAWLHNFFKQNLDDLASYFKITDVNQASNLSPVFTSLPAEPSNLLAQCKSVNTH